MSATAILLVATSIVAADGGMATIGAGKVQLLEPGDHGQVYYELTVNGEPRRIDVGPFVVATVARDTSSIAAEPHTTLRVGYEVEVRLPISRQDKRLEPAEPVSDQVPESYPLQTLPPAPAQPEPTKPVSEVYPQLTLPLVPVEPEPGEEKTEPPAAPRDVVDISSGHYAIGLDPSKAQFFNQTPRHEVLLNGYAMDRRPVRKGSDPSSDSTPLTGLIMAEAQFHCQELGLRLPTEQEWEVAAQTPGFVAQPGLFEWTASWYQAYPGNSRSDERYGETYRVLRRSSDGSTELLFTRSFMNPQQRNSKVGFRCADDPR